MGASAYQMYKDGSQDIKGLATSQTTITKNTEPFNHTPRHLSIHMQSRSNNKNSKCLGHPYYFVIILYAR